MAKLRVYRHTATGLEPVKLRVFRHQMSGNAVVFPKLRVYRHQAAGAAAAVLVAVADRTVQPETIVSTTIAVLDGVVPDSWSWTVKSGPAVTFTGSGGSRSFRAPSTVDSSGRPVQVTVQIGVRATVGSYTSPELVFNVTIRPQTIWARAGVAGAPWVGNRPS